MLIETKNWHIVSGKEQFFVLLMQDGKREVKKYVRKRTLDQNAYLRSWVYWTIAESSWEDIDYLHEVCRQMFLMDRTKKIHVPKSTTKLSTVEFNKYVEDISNRISEYWIEIPTPEQFKEL